MEILRRWPNTVLGDPKQTISSESKVDPRSDSARESVGCAFALSKISSNSVYRCGRALFYCISFPISIETKHFRDFNALRGRPKKHGSPLGSSTRRLCCPAAFPESTAEFMRRRYCPPYIVATPPASFTPSHSALPYSSARPCGGAWRVPCR